MKGIVVIYNVSEETGTTLRHIVEWTGDFDVETCKLWYYEEYRKLDGDQFLYFENKEDAYKFANQLGNDVIKM